MKSNWKTKTIKSLEVRLEKLNKQLDKFNSLIQEKAEIENCLKSLNATIRKPANGDTFSAAEERPISVYKPVTSYENKETDVSKLSLLPAQFSYDDILPLLDNNKQRAYHAVAGWKATNKIKTVSFGKFEKV